MSKEVIKKDILQMLNLLVSNIENDEENYEVIVSEIYNDLENMNIIDLYVTRQYIKDSIISINSSNNKETKEVPVLSGELKLVPDAVGNFYVINKDGANETIVFQTQDEAEANDYIQKNGANAAVGAVPDEELKDDVSEDPLDGPKDDLPNTEVEGLPEIDEGEIPEDLEEEPEDSPELAVMDETLNRANDLINIIDNSIDVVPDLDAITDLVNIKVSIQDKIDELNESDPNSEDIDAITDVLKSELEKYETSALDIINKSAPGGQEVSDDLADNNIMEEEPVEEKAEIEENNVVEEITSAEEFEEPLEEPVEELEEPVEELEEPVEELEEPVEELEEEPAGNVEEVVNEIEDLLEELVRISSDSESEEETFEEPEPEEENYNLEEFEEEEEVENIADSELVTSEEETFEEPVEELEEEPLEEPVEELEEEPLEEPVEEPVEEELDNSEDTENIIDHIVDIAETLDNINNELKDVIDGLDVEEPELDSEEEDLDLNNPEEFLESSDVVEEGNEVIESADIETSTLNPFDWDSLEDGEKKDPELEVNTKINDQNLIPEDDGVEKVGSDVVDPETTGELPLEGENPLTEEKLIPENDGVADKNTKNIGAEDKNLLPENDGVADKTKKDIGSEEKKLIPEDEGVEKVGSDVVDPETTEELPVEGKNPLTSDK